VLQEVCLQLTEHGTESREIVSCGILVRYAMVLCFYLLLNNLSPVQYTLIL